MNAYTHERAYRFRTLLEMARLDREKPVRILDLGCGPGPLSFEAIRHYPNAYVVAVDINPVLLAMGRHVAKETTQTIEFIEADFRQAGWWAPFRNSFDLVMSATTLHWLSESSLRTTHSCIFGALKPGGRFLNSDHFASDVQETTEFYRQLTSARQEEKKKNSGADTWEQYWEWLTSSLGNVRVSFADVAPSAWEGTDDGLPKHFHYETLRNCGFDEIEFHWQDLGDGILSAKKPNLTASQ